ncbi:hypothetical protein [Nocardia asiatica]|uniref:hypothetical protein n=1 Tax=Nocardia asiatica TaxID=209252 RepID=UPI0002F4586D|nr:hypothetical protein [Nocardia asiatica]
MQHNGRRQCHHGQRCGRTVRHLPLHRLLRLREQAARAGNEAAVAVLDRLIAQRDTDTDTDDPTPTAKYTIEPMRSPDGLP